MLTWPNEEIKFYNSCSYWDELEGFKALLRHCLYYHPILGGYMTVRYMTMANDGLHWCQSSQIFLPNIYHNRQSNIISLRKKAEGWQFWMYPVIRSYLFITCFAYSEINLDLNWNKTVFTSISTTRGQRIIRVLVLVVVATFFWHLCTPGISYKLRQKIEVQILTLRSSKGHYVCLIYCLPKNVNVRKMSQQQFW